MEPARTISLPCVSFRSSALCLPAVTKAGFHGWPPGRSRLAWMRDCPSDRSESCLTNGYKAGSGDSSETTPCLADDDQASLFQPPSQLDSEAQCSNPTVSRKHLPPMVQLLRDPKILVTLLEIAVAASILSAFEAVRSLFIPISTTFTKVYVLNLSIF